MILWDCFVMFIWAIVIFILCLQEPIRKMDPNGAADLLIETIDGLASKMTNMTVAISTDLSGYANELNTILVSIMVILAVLVCIQLGVISTLFACFIRRRTTGTGTDTVTSNV